MTQPLVLTTETQVCTPTQQTLQHEKVIVEAVCTVALNSRDIGAAMVLLSDLEEFGVGFLFGQGYLEHPEQLVEVLVCPEGRVTVCAHVDENAATPKEVVITSGCGGTGRIDKAMLSAPLPPPLEATITSAETKQFVRQVLHASPLGAETHGVHGCGLWNQGKLQVFFEDIGRHNAIDKVIGAILLGQASAAGALYTTGRLTSDMVLKCARIGIPIIMSRTAPSSLGLAIARRAGTTLVAYARPERLNIFHAPERILFNKRSESQQGD